MVTKSRSNTTTALSAGATIIQLQVFPVTNTPGYPGLWIYPKVSVTVSVCVHELDRTYVSVENMAFEMIVVKYAYLTEHMFLYNTFRMKPYN